MGEITSPSEIAGIQEANTAVLPSGMPLNELMLKSQQLHWAHQEAERQRKDKELADNMKMFDFNTVGVWDKDVDAINKMKDDGIKQYMNPDFQRRYHDGDLNALTQYQNWVTGMDAAIDLSKRRKVYDGQNHDLLTKDPNYNNEANQKMMKDFEQPLNSNFYSLDKTPPSNPFDFVEQSKIQAPDVTTKTEVKNGDGTFTTKEITTAPLTGAKSLESYSASVQADADKMKELNQIWLNTTLPSKTGQVEDAPYDVYDDLSRIDKTGNVTGVKGMPIPTQKLTSQLTPTDVLNHLLVVNRYLPNVNQGIKGSVYHGDGNGGDSKNGVLVQYKENIPLSIDAAQIDPTTGEIGTKDIKTLTMKGGWDVSSIFNEPASVYISSVDKWIPVDRNVMKENLPKKSGAQKVDIVRILDVPLDNEGTIRDLSNSTKTERMALVSLDGESYLIPYNKDVEQKLYDFAKTNSKLDNFEGLFKTDSPTNTGTQQQGVKPKEDLRKKYNY